MPSTRPWRPDRWTERKQKLLAACDHSEAAIDRLVENAVDTVLRDLRSRGTPLDENGWPPMSTDEFDTWLSRLKNGTLTLIPDDVPDKPS